LNVKGESYRLKEKRRAGVLGPARVGEEASKAGRGQAEEEEDVVEHFGGKEGPR
jgi:hypothetical protein